MVNKFQNGGSYSNLPINQGSKVDTRLRYVNGQGYIPYTREVDWDSIIKSNKAVNRELSAEPAVTEPRPRLIQRPPRQATNQLNDQLSNLAFDLGTTKRLKHIVTMPQYNGDPNATNNESVREFTIQVPENFGADFIYTESTNPAFQNLSKQRFQQVSDSLHNAVIRDYLSSGSGYRKRNELDGTNTQMDISNGAGRRETRVPDPARHIQKRILQSHSTSVR